MVSPKLLPLPTSHVIDASSRVAGTSDVRDDTGSQVYRPNSAKASTSAAVDATWGTRMTRSGKILQAHYCSTSTTCGAWVAGDWMSQNGSETKAKAGSSYSSILKYYYDDITLTQ